MSDDLQHSVAVWLAGNPLSSAHIDCATAVMLKILDGKCKMDSAEKLVMRALYDAVKHQAGILLGADIHALLAESRDNLDEEQRLHIYEQRVLAESMISRPVMKGFKAMLRETGLFEAIL